MTADEIDAKLAKGGVDIAADRTYTQDELDARMEEGFVRGRN